MFARVLTPGTASNIPAEADNEGTPEAVADADDTAAVTSAAVAAAAPAASIRVVDNK